MGYKLEFKDLDSKLYNDDGSRVISDDYLSKRFELSTKWYIKKACKYKKLYYGFSIIGIILPAMITVFNSLEVNTGLPVKLIITILSVITSVATSLLTLLKLHEKWINYRSTAEVLQRELTFFVLKTEKYNNEDDIKCNKIFGDSIEKLMAEEHLKWIGTVSPSNDKMNNTNKN